MRQNLTKCAVLLSLLLATLEPVSGQIQAIEAGSQGAASALLEHRHMLSEQERQNNPPSFMEAYAFVFQMKTSTLIHEIEQAKTARIDRRVKELTWKEVPTTDVAPNEKSKPQSRNRLRVRGATKSAETRMVRIMYFPNRELQEEYITERKYKLNKIIENATEIIPPIVSSLPGQTGTIANLKVIQVLDPKKAIVTPVWAPDDAWFLLEEFDTEGLYDGKIFDIDVAVETGGTYQYTTVSGAKRTIRKMKPVDLSSKHDEMLAYLRKKGLLDIDVLKEDKKESNTPKKSNDDIAASKLRIAKLLLRANPEVAKERLQKIVEKYPQSEAADEARELLSK